MNAKKKGGHGGGGGGGHDGAGGMRWLLTYADMITLLLALFIFLFSISSVNAAKLQAFTTEFAELFGVAKTPMPFDTPSGSQGILPVPGSVRTPRDDERRMERIRQETDRPPSEAAKGRRDLGKLREKLEGAFPDLLETGKLAMEETNEGLALRISDTTLFGLGQATITSEAVPVLETIAAFLRGVSHDVRVEGHTDNVPVTSGRYPSNWELSAARAATVVEYFIRRGRIEPERLSLAGYAEYRPLAPNEPGKGNAANRRVEIVVMEQGPAAPPSVAAHAVTATPPASADDVHPTHTLPGHGDTST